MLRTSGAGMEIKCGVEEVAEIGDVIGDDRDGRQELGRLWFVLKEAKVTNRQQRDELEEGEDNKFKWVLRSRLRLRWWTAMPVVLKLKKVGIIWVA